MTRDEALAAAERNKQEAWYAQDQAQRAQKAAAEQAARDRQIQDERYRQDLANRERYYQEQERAREAAYRQSQRDDTYYSRSRDTSSSSYTQNSSYGGGFVNIDDVLPGFSRFDESTNNYERALKNKIRAMQSGDPRAIARAEKEVAKAQKRYKKDKARLDSGFNWKTVVGIIVVIFLLYSCAS